MGEGMGDVQKNPTEEKETSVRQAFVWKVPRLPHCHSERGNEKNDESPNFEFVARVKRGGEVATIGTEMENIKTLSLARTRYGQDSWAYVLDPVR